jgi:hypothetical protein
MSTHTPGPWVEFNAIDSDGNSLPCVIATAGNICIVEQWATGGCEESQANARLIAAAPDMLAALEMAVGRWDKYGPPECMYGAGDGRMIGQMKAAIAKAKGE